MDVNDIAGRMRPGFSPAVSNTRPRDFESMRAASAIYVPMIPMGWIGAEPADRHAKLTVGQPVPNDWRDLVVDRQLACGIRITAERRGLAIYDFKGWAPGVPRGTPGPRLRTMGDVSTASKPAGAAAPCHEHAPTLLHAAGMTESPHVVRIGERDLFRADVDDACNDVWCQPAGAGQVLAN